MEIKDKIQNAIFEGLITSCKNHFYHTGGNVKVKPEYAVTYNVADAIKNDLSDGNGYNYIVVMEDETVGFAMCSVPFINYNGNDVFNLKMRGYQNSERNGNIDICIYEHSEKALCPIEVKGLRHSIIEIKKDLIRNIEFLLLEDVNTGSSILDFAYLCLLEEHRNCFLKKNIENGIKAIQKKYDKIIEEFITEYTPEFIEKYKNKLNNVKLNAIAKTVSSALLDDKPQLGLMDEIDIDNRLAQTYHIIGVVISIERKCLNN